MGTIYAGFTRSITAVSQAALDFVGTAFDIAFSLTGVMTLWLGLLGIADKAGLVKVLAHSLRGVMKRLFPDVPEDHPAMGSMVMNIAANILGLGNAATPLGLTAMAELDTLNTKKSVATDAMVMFLAINTSSVTLIPATVLALRQGAGSTNVTEVLAPIVLVTTISTVFAVILCKLFGRLRHY